MNGFQGLGLRWGGVEKTGLQKAKPAALVLTELLCVLTGVETCTYE